MVCLMSGDKRRRRVDCAHAKRKGFARPAGIPRLHGPLRAPAYHGPAGTIGVRARRQVPNAPLRMAIPPALSFGRMCFQTRRPAQAVDFSRLMQSPVRAPAISAEIPTCSSPAADCGRRRESGSGPRPVPGAARASGIRHTRRAAPFVSPILRKAVNSSS